MRANALLSAVVILLGAGAAAAPPADEMKVAPAIGEIPLTALYDRLSRSTVIVLVDLGPKSAGLGSGVVIGTGEVVTNHHVVEGARAIKVRQGSTTWDATVLSADKERDLAILRVPGLKRAAVRMRDSSTLKVGEKVFALGVPQGFDLGLQLTLSDGIISALRPKLGAHRVQTTAPISGGSSGGGLFDSRGRLVGITTSTWMNGQNLNFAQPCEWIPWVRKNGIAAASSTEPGAQTPPETEPESAYSVVRRPEVLRCNMSQAHMWATFSSGLEILQSEAINQEWVIEQVHSQLPTHSLVEPFAPHPLELVLRDLDKNAGYSRFRPTDGSRYEYFMFFSDDRISLVRDEYGQIRGEPRTISIVGGCAGLSAATYRREAADKKKRAALAHAQELEVRQQVKSPEDECLSGSADVCIALARKYASGDGVEKSEGQALAYYREACRSNVREACFEAALLYRKAEMGDRAKDLFRQACTLGEMRACAK